MAAHSTLYLPPSAVYPLGSGVACASRASAPSREVAMRWSWRVGKIAGIDVHVHATFWLLLIWIGLVRYRMTGSVAAVVPELVFILAVFAIVVLHELGHALAARRFGVATRDITLLPIGGVARLDRMPREPQQELVIALAGPAVNFALAAVLYVAVVATGGVSSVAEASSF